jgi:hypothetical protein
MCWRLRSQRADGFAATSGWLRRNVRVAFARNVLVASLQRAGSFARDVPLVYVHAPRSRAL